MRVAIPSTTGQAASPRRRQRPRRSSRLSSLSLPGSGRVQRAGPQHDRHRTTPPRDLTLLGATGFTGRQTAALLARRPRAGLPSPLSGSQWSPTGGPGSGSPVSPDLRVVDALSRRTQPPSLATRVLVTTVGPYALYGSEVLAACAEAGTHYADITGEVHWVRDMIERWHPWAPSRRGPRSCPSAASTPFRPTWGSGCCARRRSVAGGRPSRPRPCSASGAAGSTAAPWPPPWKAGPEPAASPIPSVGLPRASGRGSTAHYDLMRPGLRPPKGVSSFFMARSTQGWGVAAPLSQGLWWDYGPSYQEALGVRPGGRAGPGPGAGSRLWPAQDATRPRPGPSAGPPTRWGSQREADGPRRIPAAPCRSHASGESGVERWSARATRVTAPRSDGGLRHGPG